MDKENIQQRIGEIETAMQAADFWSDKHVAQAMIKELGELKDSLEGLGKYDKGNAVITIFAGAGGDDAEDFCCDAAPDVYEVHRAPGMAHQLSP